MESRVQSYEMILKSDILDGSLAANLEIDTRELPPPDNDFNYELTVDFAHERIHDEAKIMTFPVEDRPNIKSRKPKDRMYDALSKQLSNIEERFIAFGYDFDKCSIDGRAFDETDRIVIRLFKGRVKEIDKKGRPQNMKVYTIAPSVPDLNILITKAFAEIALKRDMEVLSEAKKRDEHIPNNIVVSTVFELIANGIFMDQRISKSSKKAHIQEAVSKLMSCFKVQKEWPLEMTGHIGENGKGDCASQKVDCSEWMVYSQDKEGKWSFRAVDSADEAQKVIERDVKNKSTEVVVVLHHLFPVSYSLMVQGKSGFSLIEKKDAPQHKHIQVVWRNIV